MPEYVYLIIFSVASVIALFIISKILGKKQIAQLDFIDYVVGISIGSIAANMATDVSQNPVWYYLIAMGIFFLFSYTITYLGRKGTFFKRFLKGKPLTIIYDGQIDYEKLRKSRLNVNDLLGLCRTMGYFDLNDIAYAVFETSGQLSIMPKGAQRPTVIEDMTKDYEQASLPCYLIVDGKISYSGLNELNKDENWLFEQAGVNDKQDLKDIILASYDDENQQVVVHKKSTNVGQEQ